MLASLSVGEHDVRSALGVSAVLLVVSLSTIVLLNRPTGPRSRQACGRGQARPRMVSAWRG